MRILSSDLSMRASHSLQTRTETTESLRMWQGTQREEAPSVVLQISAPAQAASAGGATGAAEVGSEANKEVDAKLAVLRFFVEKLTGKRMQLFDGSKLAETPVQGGQGGAAAAEPDFGLEFDMTRVYTEQEDMQFTAAGTVRTADGRTLSFELNLSASRSYRLEETVSVRAGQAAVQRKDPLVLNFNGTAPQLSETRFRFDIDDDGKLDDLPMLQGGNGFLALDINGNGKIDSGKELFGARSGDGFAELSAYDDDNNGVIDEGDSVFARLRIWVPGEGDGAGSLQSLRDAGVGALFLDRVDTPFTLRTAASELGAVRATGIYLSENGMPGVMQQIDLFV